VDGAKFAGTLHVSFRILDVVFVETAEQIYMIAANHFLYWRQLIVMPFFQVGAFLQQQVHRVQILLETSHVQRRPPLSIFDVDKTGRLFAELFNKESEQVDVIGPGGKMEGGKAVGGWL
jgi:hypothetical protein